MTNLDITTLEASVEALIQQQVATYEAGLREALARKLSGHGTKKRKASKSRASGRGSRATGPRRTSEELEALSERLLSAVESNPGETMVTIATSLGLTTAELARPAVQLKKSERVKTVGERSRMRYYPMTPRAA